MHARNPSRQPQPPRIIRTKRKLPLEPDAQPGITVSSSTLKIANAKQVGNIYNKLEITPLGAGGEVGRSCILLSFKGKKIMLDCGVHPGYSGLASLPFFDQINPTEIDLLLCTHFHLDHAAAIPYFLQKTKFKGQVFMTPPTKAIFKLLLDDFVKLSGTASGKQGLYDKSNLHESLENIQEIKFHQQKEVSGIKFVALSAGHVLGAAMFLIEIDGVRILYTGDYSREEDRHLRAADIPDVKPDILITESTYGIQNHPPRLEREYRFTNTVQEIVKNGGKCLIPVFALGRSQELLLILEEHWQVHPDLHNIPIFYASALADKALTVYQTAVDVMNDHIRKRFIYSNPWKFSHIKNLQRGIKDPQLQQFIKRPKHYSVAEESDNNPCVVFASPGMLQSGMSRDLFERWCSNGKNGCLLPGYCVEGTLAKTIMKDPKTIPKMDGTQIQLRCSVHYISFSAHVDFLQIRDFIDILEPPNIVLVHGEANEMNRLRSALMDRYGLDESALSEHARKRADRRKKRLREESTILDNSNIHYIFAPKNCQTVELEFQEQKMVQFLGQLSHFDLDSFQNKNTTTELEETPESPIPKTKSKAKTPTKAKAKGKQVDDEEEETTNKPTTTTTEPTSTEFKEASIQALLVRHEFNDWILEPSELQSFTEISASSISQAIRFPFSLPWEHVKKCIYYFFMNSEDANINESSEPKIPKKPVKGKRGRGKKVTKKTEEAPGHTHQDFNLNLNSGTTILIKYLPPNYGQISGISIDWVSDPTADAIVHGLQHYLLLISSDPSVLQRTLDRPLPNREDFLTMLDLVFGIHTEDFSGYTWNIRGSPVHVSADISKISCDDPELYTIVKKHFDRVTMNTAPLKM